MIDLVKNQRESLQDAAMRDIEVLGFSPDGRYLLFAKGERRFCLLWDLARKRVIRVPWNTGFPCWWGCSHELCTYIDDRKLEWWDPMTGEIRTTSCKVVARSEVATFSPDGRFFASYDSTARKSICGQWGGLNSRRNSPNIGP